MDVILQQYIAGQVAEATMRRAIIERRKALFRAYWPGAFVSPSRPPDDWRSVTERLDAAATLP